MKILVFGHSLCAPRQIRFWRYFASLGHTVLVLAPRRWMFHEIKDSEDGNFTVKGVDLFGGLRVRGLLDITREFKPDVIYSNEPTYSGGSLQAVQVGKELGVTVAIFEWDNVYHTSPLESKVLENADILIPGCPGARRILKKKGVPENKLSKPIIQVGIDTNLFKPLKIKKEFDTVTCFTAGTMVCGNCKAIESMQIGDEVLSSNGSMQKTLNVFKRPYEGELLEVKVKGVPPVKVTPEHLFKVTRFKRTKHKKDEPLHWERIGEPIWKEAQHLTEEDYVMIPRVKAEYDFFISFRRGRKGHGGRPFMDKRPYSKIKIDKELAWLLGLWVAEGFASHHDQGVIFSLGKKEKQLQERAMKIINEKLGLKALCYEQHSVRRIYFFSKDIVAFLKDSFGYGARNKRIPSWLLQAKRDIIRGFIEGWFSGDGYKHKNGNLCITTVSKRLAFDAFLLFAKLGIPVSVSIRRRNTSTIQGRTVNCLNSYTLRFSEKFWKEKKITRSYSKLDKDYLYLKIEKIRRRKVKTIVYNIETEDQTYSVPFLVHNCAGFTENKGITDIKRTVKKLGLKHLWLGASRPYDKLKEPIDYGYIPGWMNYEELPKWYNKAKVHVLFSHDTPEWKEQNAPYSNLEALACGLSVVMTKAGDAPHFLKGCRAALLIPQNNVEALTEGIKIMLNYKGENGRDYVSENFGYEKIAEDLVKIFGKSWT